MNKEKLKRKRTWQLIITLFEVSSLMISFVHLFYLFAFTKRFYQPTRRGKFPEKNFCRSTDCTITRRNVMTDSQHRQINDIVFTLQEDKAMEAKRREVKEIKTPEAGEWN